MRRTCLPVAVLASAVLLVPATAHAATWTAQSPPNPGTAISSGLIGVSCAGASDCLATGTWDDGAGPYAQGSRWVSGTGWTAAAPATPAGAATFDLSGVSCTGASACTAVGTADAGTPLSLAERWTGSWATQTTPNPATPDEVHLTGVSCSSSTECTAVGSATVSGVQTTLAMRWSSSRWAIQSTPSPVGAIAASLTGVSCDASANCKAVGTYYDSLGNPLTLGLTRTAGTGSWTVESTPNNGSASGSFLSAISCTSGGDCTAVGFSTGTAVEPLAMTRTSGRWTLVSPAPPTPRAATGAVLSGVSCTSSTFCTAVGYSWDATGSLPLAQDRSSGTWTIVSSPLPVGAISGQFVGVSCSARQVCTAVGSQNDGTTQTNLAGRYQ